MTTAMLSIITYQNSQKIYSECSKKKKSIDEYISTDSLLIILRKNVYPVWRRWSFL